MIRFALTKSRGRSSVIASAVQVVISGLVFFALFRYLYDTIGVEQIGVWSLVLATTSVSRIGELGLSAGVVRFVAKALGDGDDLQAAEIVQTVAITLGVVMGVLIVSLYPLLVYFIGKLVPLRNVSLAVSILPCALASLWVMIAVSVFSGAMDGCQRIALRCLLTGASHLLYFAFVLLLTPRYGLLGVALAQLFQAICLMVSSWIFLRRMLSPLPLIPVRWNPKVLREMVGYGVNFQVISIMNMLFEPMIKALMSKYGGLQALGYYEMANKLILQGRSIIVESSRVVVPSIAALRIDDVEKARDIFVTSYRLTFYVAVVFFGLLGISMTAICLTWLGTVEPVFVQFALLLNVAWFVNTLIGPAYFSNLGSGTLRANVISHIIMTLVGPILGYELGVHFGGLGVVVGTGVGLISGSLFLAIKHIRDSGFVWTKFIVPSGFRVMLVVAAILTLLSNAYASWNPGASGVLSAAAVCAAFMVTLGWTNPIRRTLLQRG